MLTAYVLTLGLCALFFGGGTEALRGGDRPRAYDGTMSIVDQRSPSAEPATVILGTPKGRRTVQRSAVGHYDIPLTALKAYQRAADILRQVKPSCGLPWTLLAGIGRVESDHGRYAGSALASDGFSTPEVIGVALDGQGPVASIPDTDNGRLDHDPTWDHAVGPMQFLPSTWTVVGVDADADGKRSINDINDAALAAGVYLCAGSEQSLRSPAAMDAALHRYNDSDAYAALVMAYERLYRGGDFQVVTDGGVATASAALVSHPLTGAPLTARGPAQRRIQGLVTAQARHAAALAKRTGAAKGIKAAEHAARKISGGGQGPASTAASAPSATGGSSKHAGGTTGTGATGTGPGSTTPGSTTPSTTGPGGSGGDSGATTPAAPSSDPTTPAPDTSSPDTTSPDPTTTPTPTPTAVTGVLTEQDGVYYLDGKPLDLGVLAQSAATAAGDFDGDGTVETNGDELAGLVGATVAMVVVEGTDGTLGIYSINGISLG